MKKHIEIAKHISSDLEKDYTEYLKENNYHRVFESIYGLREDNSTTNILICAIIYSYSNSSKWIDLKADGYSINKSILNGLKADLKKKVFIEFMEMSNDDIVDSIGYFYDTMKADWRFVTARKNIDFHSANIRQENVDWSKVDEKDKPKVRENIGRTMKLAVEQRQAADMLISELEKNFVSTNHRTEQEFGIKFTDTEISVNPESWRDFIKYTVPILKANANPAS